MNKLDRPNYDDDAALDALAANRQVGSYPILHQHVAVLKAAYDQYIAANGDVRVVNRVVLPDDVADNLRKHYGSPPKDLAHITEIRTQSDTHTCPMCGSLHSGTLDHVMDKEDHPAFSVFTQNLVPACKCNSKRLKALIGPNFGERILHPYFDTVLSERIMAATFSDLGPTPRIATRVILDPANPNHAAATFHHKSIILRTGIHGYLSSRWSKLVLRPGVIIPELKFDPLDRLELVSIILDERERNDDQRNSKNNWDSVFLTGLLDNHVTDWIYAKLSTPRRLRNGPLV